MVTLTCNFSVELRGYESLTPSMPMEVRLVAGRGQVSLDMPFTCQDDGSMWPDIARRLPTLAPNMAPNKTH